ncbi:MAG: hypothetical protein ABMB14_27065 [Myxococcota bacterium]
MDSTSRWFRRGWLAAGLTATLVATLTVGGCDGGTTPKDTDADGDADTDADADSDTDTDSDADTDPTAGPDADDDGSPDDVDCDDADPTVFPGAPDLCGDDKVTDCDRTSDDGLVTLDGTLGFDDLGEALAAAVDGSELLLCPGTHDGPAVATVPVSIVALHDALDTTITGYGTGSTLTVVGGTAITGVTITDGAAPSGGGIRMSDTGTLVLDGVVVSNNRARVGGGIALAPGATATLIDTTVTTNVGDETGGGVYVPTGATLDLTAGSTLIGNAATYAGGGAMLDGGALIGGTVTENHLSSYGSISASYGTISYDYPYAGAGIGSVGVSSITGTDVFANDGPTGGGVTNTNGDLTLTDVAIHDHILPGESYGAGLVSIGGSTTCLGTTEIYGNRAHTGGGGFTFLGRLSGGVFRDNEAEWAGGGLVVSYDGAADGVVVSGNTALHAAGVMVAYRVTLDGLTIVDNVAAQDGGGIGETEDYLYGSNQITVIDSVISGNEADRGGGVFAMSRYLMDGTELSDNSARVGGGWFAAADVRMTGGAVVRNVATDLGGGASVDATFSATTVDFGDGVDDNVPGDVYAGSSEVSGYGAGATFTCTGGTCDP